LIRKTSSNSARKKKERKKERKKKRLKERKGKKKNKVLVTWRKRQFKTANIKLLVWDFFQFLYSVAAVIFS